jgi:hypothetical protein
MISIYHEMKLLFFSLITKSYIKNKIDKNLSSEKMQ